MPKMKTHSGTAKRFRLTGTGKVMRRRANRGHLFEKKSSRLTRRLYDEVTVAPSDVKADQEAAGQVARPALRETEHNGTRQAGD